MNWLMQVFLCIGCVLVCSASGYQIGLGRADCTGPPVEVVFVSFSNGEVLRYLNDLLQKTWESFAWV